MTRKVPTNQPATRLLAWFEAHQRDLPWRKNKTPYRIWVSEVMLQQTQVVTVVDYYKRFIKRFPNVKKLAGAKESEVLKLWEGLGYYRRARQLHAAAKQIVDEHAGRFPNKFDDVLALPGIGRYTAGAVLSIANDARHPILEGNTIRLFARMLAMKSDPRSSANQKKLWAFSESLLPDVNVGDFNQALMEVGSLVCTKQNPACGECPLSRNCLARKKGIQNEIPLAAKKLNYEDITEAVLLIQRRGKYLVRECASGERWAGLWDFPRFQVAEKSQALALKKSLKEACGLSADLERSTHEIKHAVTRFRITLHCYVAKNIEGRLAPKGQQMKWVDEATIAELPMSVTGRKIARKLGQFKT